MSHTVYYKYIVLKKLLGYLLHDVIVLSHWEWSRCHSSGSKIEGFDNSKFIVSEMAYKRRYYASRGGGIQERHMAYILAFKNGLDPNSPSVAMAKGLPI